MNSLMRNGTRFRNSIQNVIVCLSVLAALGLGGQADAQPTSNGEGLYRAPAEGGVRRWLVTAGDGLNLFAKASESAAVKAVLAAGSVLSNFGCTEAKRVIWCEVRPFRGGVRGFVLADRLMPAAGPDGVVAVGVDDSKRRTHKRDFDTEGTARCAQEKGEALGECRVAVARSSGGDATVIITFANGFARQLYFIHGEFTSASTTMSGTGKDSDWRVENGMHHIRVDDQRYQLPNALIFGGG